MPSLSQLPGEIKRKRLIKALKKLGFIIDTKGGNGSHIKAIWTNEKCFTIPDKINKGTLYYLLREIKSISGIEWDDIKRVL